MIYDVRNIKNKMKDRDRLPTDSTTSGTTWDRWPTGFWTQFRMLTWRNFKQTRGRLLHSYDLIRVAVLSIFGGIIFFQIPNTVDVFRDRMGLLFFCVSIWTFSPAIDALMAFPSERPVVSKERASGAYRLSAYYLAKTVSELPLYVITPTAFYCTVYWMAGIGDVITFFSTWPIHLLTVFNSQRYSRLVLLPSNPIVSGNTRSRRQIVSGLGKGLGLLVSTTIPDVRAARAVATTLLLMFMLLSGFITQTLPWWFDWASYLSIIMYPLRAMAVIVFQDMESAWCNSTGVLADPKCLDDPSNILTSTDVLHEAGVTLPVYCYVSSMAIIFFVFRFGGYLSLRFIH